MPEVRVPEGCLGKIRSYITGTAELDGTLNGTTVFPGMDGMGGGGGFAVFVALVGDGVDTMYCGDG